MQAVGKPRRWDDYVKEASKPPFQLIVDDTETLEIKCPDGETLMQIEETEGTRGILSLFCGDQWERVNELIGDAPGSAIAALVQDMAAHFNVGAGSGSPNRATRRSSR